MCGALLAAGSLASQARAELLATPDLSVAEEGQGRISLHVTAGANGAPAGFVVQWIARTDYDALGGWPADASDSRIRQAYFRGAPTLNTTESTTTFNLAAGQRARVEIGDLFDETGVNSPYRTELAAGDEFVFRVYAPGNPTYDASDPSASIIAGTMGAGVNCTYTQGYWKTHPQAWPVTSLMIGNVLYTQAQLLQIFNQPAQGNGLISLSHQLIAAKLNLAQGASLPGTVLTAITNADALIGNKVVPPIGAGSLTPGSTSSLTQTLDDYNNGISGPGHCGAVPAVSTTWSHIKLLK